jgi:hypothetical protein
MAGGMNRRHERTPLHERVRATARPAQLEPVKRCWVYDDRGGQPGLLLEWRRTALGWEGRVARPVPDSASWVVVVEWVAADQLRPDP